MLTVQLARVNVEMTGVAMTVATCTAVPLLKALEVTTAVRLPTVGLVMKVTTICVGLEEVTEPPAPRFRTTELLPLLLAKPNPLIVRVAAEVERLAVLCVTTGITVATCTGVPLLKAVPLVTATDAVRKPAFTGVVVKVTVSEVADAAVTLPTAPRVPNVTTLLAGVVEKPKPAITTVAAFAAMLAVFKVTTGITVAT